ncbi:MAG: GntR family transcriptional regulator [Armatimonadota bacterium]
MAHFIYLEIAATLRGRITRGDYISGRLPSERTLTTEFGVQRGTVRRALQSLEQEGLIRRDATRRGTLALSGGASARSEPSVRGGIALVIGRANDTTAPGDIARGLSQVVSDEKRFVAWLDMAAAAGHAEASAPDVQELFDRGVAAVALWPEIPIPLEKLRRLRDALPLVLLDRRVPGFESDFVGIDDFGSGRKLTEHLLGLGHRRIGFLSTAPHVSTVQARCRGWANALEDAGITVPSAWTLHRDTGGGLTAVDNPALDSLLQLKGPEPLTAVVCSNDTVAAGLMQYLRNNGIRPGEDVAVTGFGNTFPSLLDALGLTTIAQPFEKIGQTAGEILLSRLNRTDPQTPHEIELSAELVIRTSCGATPAARS